MVVANWDFKDCKSRQDGHVTNEDIHDAPESETLPMKMMAENSTRASATDYRFDLYGEEFWNRNFRVLKGRGIAKILVREAGCKNHAEKPYTNASMAHP